MTLSAALAAIVAVQNRNPVRATEAERAALQAAMSLATAAKPLFVATIRGIFERVATTEEIAAWRSFQSTHARVEDPAESIDTVFIFDERHVPTVDGFAITRHVHREPSREGYRASDWI